MKVYGKDTRPLTEGHPAARGVRAYRAVLERLDAALAKNSWSEVSEAEKTRALIERVFGPKPPAKPALPIEVQSPRSKA